MKPAHHHFNDLNYTLAGVYDLENRSTVLPTFSLKSGMEAIFCEVPGHLWLPALKDELLMAGFQPYPEF